MPSLRVEPTSFMVRSTRFIVTPPSTPPIISRISRADRRRHLYGMSLAVLRVVHCIFLTCTTGGIGLSYSGHTTEAVFDWELPYAVLRPLKVTFRLPRHFLRPKAFRSINWG